MRIVANRISSQVRDSHTRDWQRYIHIYTDAHTRTHRMV